MVLFYHYISALVDQGHTVLSLILDETGKLNKGDLDKYRCAIGKNKNFEVELVSLPGRALLPTRFGVKCDFSALPTVVDIVKNFNPDALVAFDLTAARYLRDINVAFKTVWLGDLAFQSNWYHILYSIKENWLRVRWLPYALMQKTAWRGLYQEILAPYDELVVSSKSSEAALRELGLHADFHPYPWPNGTAIDHDVERQLPDLPTFLFYGHLFGLGSRSSLHFLFSKLYPKLLAMWGKGGFRIIVGGREAPPNWALRKIKRRSEIQYIGFIENLDSVMARVHAVIAPLDVPVGNRSRILTAMAKRVLVIAHSNAAKGNPALVDHESILLAEDATKFAQRMRLAVEDRSECSRIIDRAEQVYKDLYAPKSAAPLFAEMISKNLRQEAMAVSARQ